MDHEEFDELSEMFFHLQITVKGGSMICMPLTRWIDLNQASERAMMWDLPELLKVGSSRSSSLMVTYFSSMSMMGSVIVVNVGFEVAAVAVFGFGKRLIALVWGLLVRVRADHKQLECNAQLLVDEQRLLWILIRVQLGLCVRIVCSWI